MQAFLRTRGVTRVQARLSNVETRRRYTDNMDSFDDVFSSGVAPPRGRNPMFASYRPNTDPAVGAALQFHFDLQRKCVFLQAAKQKGPKLAPGASGQQFDWEGKIVAKLSTYEIGQILHEFKSPSEKGFDLIHKSPTPDKASHQTTGIRIRKAKPGTWSISISRIIPGSEKKSVGAYIDDTDALVLSEFLRESIIRGLGFE